MANVQKNNLKIVLIIIFVVALVSGIGVYQALHQKPAVPALPQNLAIDGSFLPQPKLLQKFQLTDNTGKPFTVDSLQGHWTLLFFGFTNCGYVCPTSMAALNKMYHLLEKQLPAHQMPQVIMVSVDPDRDTVEKMNAYVKAYNPNFIGARGDEKATQQLENQLSVVAVKVVPKDGDQKNYAINHSAEIMVIDPNAQLRAFLSFPHEGKQMAKDYVTIINHVK
ncbi:MAG: SCO family protein [Legionellales bacterium]|nr:SCO family protein [Legionellales bacterium]